MARVLIVDDNDAMREGMAVALKKAGHDVGAFRSGAEAVAQFRAKGAELVVTDLKMDGMDGIELVRQVRAHEPAAVVIVVTAHGTIETAVSAMREGAHDFLTKPFGPEVLRAKVESALELTRARQRVQRLEATTDALARDAASRFGSTLVGDSPPMRRLVQQVQRAAASDVAVLVTGESGTGKELVARMLHDGSPRRQGPFVTTHCAALAESLLESELFGHERGSFTGAVKRKLGRFELADGGTIFLDEIGELAPTVQTKLLRVLQEREIQRVGGEETIKIDVRVVCATHRDLKAEAAAGRFREDLFFRLHVVPLVVPPLRDRLEDVDALARAFVAKHAPRINARVRGLTPAAVALLQRYPWPGNVRELENVIEQALVFADGEALDEGDIPASVRCTGDGPRRAEGALPVPQGDRSLPDILEDLERQLIARAYERAKGVKTETARLLGIKNSALYYKLEKYGFIQKGDKPVDDG